MSQLSPFAARLSAPKRWLRQWWLVWASLVLFTGFKILFPYPDVFKDSLHYIGWGLRDDIKIAYRPLGYTHLLMALGHIRGTHFVLVMLQFAVHVAASVFFCKTLFRLWPLPRAYRAAVYACTVFNPLAYFLFNLANPDSLFTSLSAVWLTASLRYFFLPRHRGWMLGASLFAFAALFHLRYNGIYYPFFGAAAVLLCALPWRMKLLYAVASIGLFFGLRAYAASQAERLIGVREMSGFGGWALANNALHIYRYADVDPSIWEDDEERLFGEVAEMLAYKVPYERGTVTDQYIWSDASPLKTIVQTGYEQGQWPTFFTGWWHMAPVYERCAKKLIIAYPGTFFRAFYGPNLMNYAFPTAEALDEYDIHEATQSFGTRQLLDFGTRDLPAPPMRDLQPRVVRTVRGIYCVLSPLAGLSALFFMGLYVHRAMRRGVARESRFQAAALLSAFFMLTVMLLALAHPILLRYVCLPLLYGSVVAVLAVHFIFARGNAEGVASAPTSL